MDGISRSPLEALAEELGTIAARIERDAKLQVAAVLSEIRQEMSALRAAAAESELRAVNAERVLCDTVAVRLASVRDGDPGRNGEDADPEKAAELALAVIRPEIDTLAATVGAKIDERFAEAVAAIPPPEKGEPGQDADPAEIERLFSERAPALIAERVAAEVALIPPAEPGKNADPEMVREIVSEEVERAVKALPVPADGHTPTEAELAPLVETALSRALVALPRPKDGEDGKSVDPAEVERMVAEAVAKLPEPEPGEPGPPGRSAFDIALEAGFAGDVSEWLSSLRGVPGEPGEGIVGDPGKSAFEIAEDAGFAGNMVEWLESLRGEKGSSGESIKGDPGERGSEGPPGKFAAVKAWSRGIHYESALVAHSGSTFCALCDTAEEPPHGDWALIAARGADAPVGEVRGLYDVDAGYRKFDLVSFNGAEWRAKRDDPGPLPGDGWAMSAKQGKSGQPGPRGERGEKGLSGPPGQVAPRIVDWQIDGYRAVPVMSDGDTGPPLDMREFFERYHDEAR